MHSSVSKLCALGTAFILLGLGCGSTTPQAPDGGVIRSADGGLTWQLKSDIYTTAGKVASFVNIDVNTLVADPNDSKTMWAGTMVNGLLYTTNGGEAWTPITTYSPADLMLTQARVNGIVIDPTNSCIVYATITAPTAKSYVVRTTNCGRSFGLVYTNEAAETQLQAIAINPFHNLEMYIGDSGGNVLRSTNGGGSWQKAGRFGGAIRAIALHPKHDGELFIGTKAAGFWQSPDHGQTWNMANLKAFRGAEDVYAITLDPSQGNSLLIGTKYGILRSNDGGVNWEALALLTAPNETLVLSVAVAPKNSQHIFYGTPAAFYKSEDGGKTWTNKRVPTHRVIKAILVDPSKAGTEPETIWIAAWQLPQ